MKVEKNTELIVELAENAVKLIANVKKLAVFKYGTQELSGLFFKTICPVLGIVGSALEALRYVIQVVKYSVLRKIAKKERKEVFVNKFGEFNPLIGFIPDGALETVQLALKNDQRALEHQLARNVAYMISKFLSTAAYVLDMFDHTKFTGAIVKGAGEPLIA
jgi:hypothetical protein